MADKRQVLIVDDDPDFLEQMDMMFQAGGYATRTAPGRKQAEEILQGFTPEIAVIDLMMENDDDGFILAYRLKRKFPECAVLMVTNVTGETGLEFPRIDDSAGWISADAVFSKPVRFEQLKEQLRKMGKA
ncbi:MAG TPA: response regulator [Candidatus Sabulitectum sp.]|nr:response regulator [Candidatus Sabulitectum sp.]HPR22909.1 response regulator [Candidatus Sabulitectum sp.]